MATSLVAGPGDEALARTTHDAGALPAGWELCVLQGVGATVSTADVAALDLWQQAEGGSTDNDEHDNPFNTRRGTDQSGADLPATWSSDGFPSFATWPAGCAATVATILQPDMSAITTALVSGDVSPPASFLVDVDRTPWCAPTKGAPCYSDEITDASEPAPSSALALYHDATDALDSYDQDLAGLTEAQQELSADESRLTVADVTLRLARFDLENATVALRNFAVSDYTSNPSLDKMAYALQFRAPSQTDLLTQYYTSLGSSIEVDRFDAAQTAAARSERARAGAAGTVTQESAALAAAGAATAGSLDRLDVTLATLRTAGACTSSAPPAAPAAGERPAVASLRTCLRALSGSSGAA